MAPIGPYNHIAMAGGFIRIGAVAGVDPATGALAGDSVEAQTTQIIKSFDLMLRSVGAGLETILHINVYMNDIAGFDRMNAAYVSAMGACRPARTVVGVAGLPKAGALLTMDLLAIAGSVEKAQ